MTPSVLPSFLPTHLPSPISFPSLSQNNPTSPNLTPLSISQAHVCISNTSRAGAELGYDVSVLSDGIGDRDIPGASAKQLVDVSK